MRAAYLVLTMLLMAAPARGETAVDLELVLAIDASASVDEGEFALQMQGYAAAFRDPEVIAAIAEGPRGRIAVATLVWADATVPRQPGDWAVIDGEATATAYAASIAATQRRVAGGTGIGAGIAEAILMFDRNGLRGARHVVDVSGDGIETPPRAIVVEMPQARAMAIARGVTINGLAIVNEAPGLATWYRRNVIAGPRAFVITAADFEAFADAIRRKLLREIRGLPNVASEDGQAERRPPRDS